MILGLMIIDTKVDFVASINVRTQIFPPEDIGQ